MCIFVFNKDTMVNLKFKIINNNLMKQKLRLMMTMLLLAVMGSAWAEESIYKTALFGLNYNSKGVSSYTDTWTATTNGFTVSLSNFNNNNNDWEYVKCGRKNNASVGSITTTSTIDKAITKVVVTVDAFTLGKINSFKLYVASNNSFTTNLQTISLNITQGKNVFVIPTPSENLFYKVEADCASGSSNGLVTISKIDYYFNDSGMQKIVTPTFSPEEGEVAKGTAIYFNCATEGVTYYYTTDGTDPTTTSSASGDSYTVTADVTLKVIAVKDGMENSAVATASYTVLKNDPELAFSESRVTANIGETFTPPTLSYAEGYDGTITYSSSNSAITVNASTGEVSYGVSAVGKTTTITATASETADFYGGTATYVLSVVDPNLIEGNLNNTTFGTSYKGSITPISSFTSVTGTIGNVEVTYAKGDASYAYINDSQIRLYYGSELTFTVPDGYYIKSLTFNNPISSCTSDCGNISDKIWSTEEDVTSVTIYGPSSSNVQLATVYISLAEEASAIAKPTITPSSGTYTTAQTVTITNNAEGATIYYTTDGSVPTASSTVYSKPFELSANGTYTIKAIAINGDEKSSVVTSNIVIKVHVDAPVFAEEDGTSFTEPYTIHLTSAQGTTIYYTTGSASPIDENGNLTADAKVYNATTGIANLTKAITITAVAIDKGGNYSDPVSASYTYSGEVSVPYYENFDEGLGNFTTEPVNEGTKDVKWEFQTNNDVETYGEKRKYAFITGGTKNNMDSYVGEDRLISPVLDLTNYETVTMNFVHAGHWFGSSSTGVDTDDSETVKKASCHLQVRKVGDTEWTDISIPNWFVQKRENKKNMYERINSGDIDLSSYKGQKIQVCFYFTSTSETSGTWNVLKFAVTGTQEEEVVNYESVNMKTDGYITYVVKNDIDWDATMKMNAGVYGYKVIQFTEAAKGGNGTTVLVELGNNVEMAVDEEKTETPLTDEQKKPLWSEKITPAGTPIILKGHAGDNLLVIAKSDDVIPSVKGNLLKPSFGDVQGSSAQTLYVLQKTSDWVDTDPYNNYLFYKLANGRQIPDRKAYLNGADASEEIIYYLANKPDAQGPGDPVVGPQGMRNFIILSHTESEQLVSEDAGIPDGIQAVSGDNETKDRVFYSISGVKVSNPTKGIYILNGKKVIVK